MERQIDKLQLFRLIWSLVRQVVGWFCIIIGLIIAPLPIPLGLPLIAVGVVVVGRRNKLMRWIRVHMSLFIRYLATKDIAVVSEVARLFLRVKKRFLNSWRERKQRLAACKMQAAIKPEKSVETIEQ